MMTDKHFRALAAALRDSNPRRVPPSGEHTSHGHDCPTPQLCMAYDAAWRQWQTDYHYIAAVCMGANRAFDYDRFARAAGYEAQPDGQLYPVSYSDRL